MKYNNLKGQYGQGIESCLLDFSTFPGPIILTTHSLYNIENLYRGRLYTTDSAYSKGVIPIKNYDFSDVKKSANEMKGFKTGKICESETIGFDYKEVSNLIKAKVETNKYTNVFIIGSYNYHQNNTEYFKKLTVKAPKDFLVISLSPAEYKEENILSINGCFDTYSLINVTNEVDELTSIPKTIFIPACDRDSLAQIIYFASLNNTEVYMGQCSPKTINPSLITFVKEIFPIKEISTVKNDLDQILNK